MRIYLAARYSRRLELCGYRDQLHAMGHNVQACWLDGSHQISDDGSASERAAALRAKFARDDMNDVLDCQTLIAFTEPPRSNASRGGRHVELGIALGRLRRVMIVGPRENVFCWLPEVRQFDTWEECLASIKDESPWLSK